MDSQNTPKGCDDLDFIRFSKLLRTMQETGWRYGLQGDCMADTGSRCGTHCQEQLVVDICLSLPAEVRRSNRELARRMARAMVLTHHDNDDKHDANFLSQSYVDTTHQGQRHVAIEREFLEASSQPRRQRGHK